MEALKALTPTEMVLGLLVILLVAVALALWLRNRRSANLKSRFGPEYNRAVSEVGTEREAEALLHAREKRVAKFSIRPLSAEKRDRFVLIWRKVQADFVDDPKAAVTHADDLLGEVMETRGYPVTDFEQRSADLSVDHPEMVQNYRAAHEIALQHARGEAGTEDLRRAMIHYRALFDDLVNEPPSTSPAEIRAVRNVGKEPHRS